MALLLLVSVFVISTCGLIYELIAGALASYLLGDSVTQFSTVIGVYLSAMGVGSYLSRYVKKNLLQTFIKVELLIGLVGGSSAGLLFLIFEHAYSFRAILYLLVLITGILVGLEIPLILKILNDKMEFSEMVSKVLSFDYIGALVASVLFPILLVPRLGLIKTSFMFGIFNVIVALWALYIFDKEIPWVKTLKSTAFLVLIILCGGFVSSDRILTWSESALYPSGVIYSKTSPYQRIVVTKNADDVSLFLNGHLQFSSRDEYRYHETLVHVGMQSVPSRKKILVLGGGDGLAVREILKYPDVDSVTLVDLDGEMTALFRQSDLLSSLNEHAFDSPKVRVINADAFLWLKETSETFDFVVVDFPDPTSYSLGKLYSTTFYRLLQKAMTPEALIVVQSTSPLLARKSYWCVNETLEQSGFATTPYHVYVPSFGEWGFVLAGTHPFHLSTEYLPGLRFLNPATLQSLLYFPADMDRVEVEANKLTNQVLVRYYDQEWSKYVS